VLRLQLRAQAEALASGVVVCAGREGVYVSVYMQLQSSGGVVCLAAPVYQKQAGA
jgi:hypothetical protein